MLNKTIDELRKEGFRITPVRKELLEILALSKKPMSVSDLAKKLSLKKIFPNKTTLYRELDFLNEQKLIRPLFLNSSKRMYEITGIGHHHHLMCMKCEKVEDVEMENDLHKYENKLSKKTSFKILNHSLEFFGLCKSCK